MGICIPNVNGNVVYLCNKDHEDIRVKFDIERSPIAEYHYGMELRMK